MKRSILATLALITMAHYAVADGVSTPQFVGREATQGMLFNRDIMSISEMGQFSQSTFNYGTARSMAMAGAMTSLGGDASSMMINPAGLGMYRTGELIFTPIMTMQRSDTKGGERYLDDGRNTLTVSNFSTLFNLYESGKTKLISLNMGLGYNKISDLNYDYSYMSIGQNGSIANTFSRQLTEEGIPLDDVYGSDYPDWSYMPTNVWGAVLGYKAGMTFQKYGSTPSDYGGSEAISPSPSGSPIWSSTWLNPSAEVDQFMAVESDGSIGEYDIALGANLDNKLYVGFTLGIQRVYQRVDLMYGEEYFDNDMGGGNELLFSKYNQTIITAGAGVNLKLGAIYRATESLRLGLSYHSPTWYNLDREYQASLGATSIVDGKVASYVADSRIIEDYGVNSWRFNSPSRLLLGGSYTFENRGLISVDYQCDWYGSIKTRSLPYGVPSELYGGISDIYKSVNTLRMGGEYKLAPSFAIRGGYGFSTSMVRDDICPLSLGGIPTTNSVEYYSMGVGYSPSRVIRFDLTYMRQMTDYNMNTLFMSLTDSDYDALLPSAERSRSGSYYTRIKANNIALSMVIRM